MPTLTVHFRLVSVALTESFQAVENVDDTKSPIADTYELKTAHLTPFQCSFFKKWEALLAFEEQDLVRFKKELWTMGASEREAKGRCFASMVMDPSHGSVQGGSSASKDDRIHQFTYKFVRAGGGVPTTSFLNGHMSEGDAVTVSVEPDLLALARGFILELTPQTVVVGVDHKLSLDVISSRLATRAAASQIIFRIDKDELFGGMGRIRDNLAQLFYANGDTRRLELVVDLKPPAFDDADSTNLLALPPFARYSAHLNPNQRQAMNKVLTAHDYSLILGMPGTGKTTVIATIIKTLVGMGKTVLLTSYTHSAVDTILLKLKNDADFGILRLGNADKVWSPRSRGVYGVQSASLAHSSAVGL
jgi:DNA replication ATP-dependent helicase Dna2